MSALPSTLEQAELVVPITRKRPVPPYVARVPMTAEEFLAWDHGNRLAEWVDGEAFLYITTTESHATLVNFLSTLLSSYLQIEGPGVVYTGPYAFRAVPDGPIREPDIAVVRGRKPSFSDATAYEGAPDLVVEIVSDDSTTRDRRTKYREYEAAGVREYWVIDPRQGRQREEFFALEDGAYGPIAADSEGRVHSRALPGFWVRPAWLRDPEAQPLRCLAEIVGPDRIIEALR